MAAKDLGVWKAAAPALVLIDYQPATVEVIRSEANANVVQVHVGLPGKAEKALDMPSILATVGVGFGFNEPSVPSLLEELEGIEPTDRTSSNASKNQAFSEAVAARAGSAT